MSVGSDARMQALDDVLDAAQSESTADSGIVGRIVGAVRGAPSESDLRQLSADLFAVVDALASSAGLRRAVTDPGRPESERQRLVHGLLDGKVSETAVDIVAEGAAMRWAGGQTFAAALDRQAVRAQLMVAERDGTLEEAEDELFRFARLVESTPELRNALGDRSVGLAQRQELVGELLDGRATETTVVLARRAVAARERTFAHTIEGFVTLAAAQKHRVVATVRVAQAPDQRASGTVADLAQSAGRPRGRHPGGHRPGRARRGPGRARRRAHRRHRQGAPRRGSPPVRITRLHHNSRTHSSHR